MGDNRNRWTPRQDRIIMKCKSPRAAHRAIGKKHTLGSIIQRRYQLRHLETVVARWHPGERLWTKDEKGVLRERWRTSTSAKDLAPYLPRFTLCQIRSKARKMGLKRRPKPSRL